MSDSEERRDFVISPTVFYALLAAATVGGGGLSAVATPALSASSNYAHAQIAADALEIASANTAAIVELRNLLLERTTDRYTKSDHAEHLRSQLQRDDLQNKRLTFLENKDR